MTTGVYDKSQDAGARRFSGDQRFDARAKYCLGAGAVPPEATAAVSTAAASVVKAAASSGGAVAGPGILAGVRAGALTTATIRAAVITASDTALSVRRLLQWVWRLRLLARNHP